MISQLKEEIAVPVPEILWHSCDGMMVIDGHRRILAMNPALEKLTGRRSEEVVGKSECGILFSCRDLRGCPLADHPWECPGVKAMREFKPVQGVEYTIRSAQGKGVVVSASYTPIQLPGRPIWALVVMRDATAKKREELRLIQQAKTDPLTGLPNRAAFLETTQKELKRAKRFHRLMAVAMADLDQFKSYNDLYGHPAGDELLKSLAGVFQAGRRATDLIARYGGDEFAILLPETGSAGASVVTQHLCFAIAKFPFARGKTGSAGSFAPPVTISIGVAVFPDEGTTLENLLALADQRLYNAKLRGGNRVALAWHGSWKGGSS